MKDFVRKCHEEGNKQVILTVTGGGTEAIGELLRYGGGSKTFLSAYIPYSTKETVEFIGEKRVPEKFCSMEMADALASMQMISNDYIEGDEETFVSIAATSSLGKTGGEREGREHKIFISAWHKNMIISQELYLESGRTREEEETLNAKMIINMYANAVGIEDQMDLGLLDGEVVKEKIIYFTDQLFKIYFSEYPNWTTLYDEVDEWYDTGAAMQKVGDVETDLHGYKVNLEVCETNTPNKTSKMYVLSFEEMPDVDCIYPGSFNPIHEGHIDMADLAEAEEGELAFEISVRNCDKADVLPNSLIDRIEKIFEVKPKANVFVTNACFFFEKSTLFKAVNFVVGLDTWVRLCDSNYLDLIFIDDIDDHKNKCLNEKYLRKIIYFDRNKFLCFHRNGVKNKAMSQTVINGTRMITEDMWSKDVSSTDIRKGS